MQWQCKIANSLGDGFAGHPNTVWNTRSYENDQDPTVFFGLYGLPDFYALWRHKGRKAIFYAGSDIRHLKNNYWLDEDGDIRIDNEGMCQWINKYCENWCENEVERKALEELGIESLVCPSFLGNVDDYPLQKLSKEIRYYSSVSGNDFKLYGWDKINKIAEENPNVKYYLYGNTIKWEAPKNVIVRGRMGQKEMDVEIRSMTGAIRMVKFEGSSEVVLKSILYGQKRITLIEYPYDRKKLLQIVNRYPWNLNVGKMSKLSKRVSNLSE